MNKTIAKRVKEAEGHCSIQETSCVIGGEEISEVNAMGAPRLRSSDRRRSFGFGIDPGR